MKLQTPNIETVPIGQLKPWGKNPRKGHALAAIEKSIEAFGYLQPIIVQAGTFRVLAGHGRLEALKNSGTEDVPVIVVEISDQDADLFTVADNKTGDRSSWDVSGLQSLLSDLQDAGAALDLTGFKSTEIERLLQTTFDKGAAPKDAEPSKDLANPVSRRGDIWTLGNHTLMVGDATDLADVTFLFNDRGQALGSADMMFTDPPYGVIFGSAKQNAISGDLSQSAIPIGFAVAVEHVLNENARLYICGGSTNFTMYARLFDYHLQQQPRPIVWVKEHFVIRRNNYHSQYEFVYFGWKGRGGSPEHWYGGRDQVDVWHVSRDRKPLHPTQKPVELARRAIANSCPQGRIVYEPFAGSGSTIIAAEELGRRCFALEIDPRWADVCVLRYLSHVKDAMVGCSRPEAVAELREQLIQAPLL